MSSVASLCLAALVLVGCSSGQTADGASSAAPVDVSAAAVVSSGPPAASASAVVHDPGTVPPSAASVRPAVPVVHRLPPVAPKLERRAAFPSPRKGPRDLGATSWVDREHLALESPGRVEVVDLRDATSIVLITGARIRMFEATSGHVVTLDESDRVILWDRAATSAPRTWQLPDESAGGEARVTLSATGERVAFANEKSVKVWDGPSGKEVFAVTREVPTFQLVVTRDEVVATSNNVSIDAWRIDDGKPTATTGFDTGATFGIVVSADGRWGAGGSPAGHGLEVSEIRRSGSLRRLVDSTDCRHHVSPWFSRDGRHVYGYLGQDWIKGFDTATWRPYASYRAEPGRSIATLSDDLGRVVTTREGLEPQVVAVSTKKATALERPLDATASYSMNEDGSMIVGRDESRAVRVWSARTAAVVFEISSE